MFRLRRGRPVSVIGYVVSSAISTVEAVSQAADRLASASTISSRLYSTWAASSAASSAAGPFMRQPVSALTLTMMHRQPTDHLIGGFGLLRRTLASQSMKVGSTESTSDIPVSMRRPGPGLAVSEIHDDSVTLLWDSQDKRGSLGKGSTSTTAVAIDAATVTNDKEGKHSSAAPIIKSQFHYSWLRDNCQCAKCVLASNGQKLHSSGSVSPTIKPAAIAVQDAAVLTVQWPAEGEDPIHHSEYSAHWLQTHSYSGQELRSSTTLRPLRWDGAYFKACTHRVSYDEFFNHYSGFRSVLQQLNDFGLVFLTGVPTNDKQVEALVRRMGPIQETFYGSSWDVRHVEDANNIAYTSLPLGLHMDLMYYESPPGLQLLHCLQNSVAGGESLFVDSHLAVDILKREHPTHYDTLTKVPVLFKYQKDLHHMQYHHPTIVPNDADLGVQVYYAPPFQGPLDAPSHMVQGFYEAFRVFEEILNRKELEYTTLLQPGDCVIFSNRRVLHGRRQFDARKGDRHLKGAYISWDDFKDMVRVHII
ncbi:hypothetical protein BASA83_008042 [Batrachochytrium salamandrivorans]|nr:hypothetical protein BASA83_008042 [Batrachochytrium salamandrivorans]